MKNIISLILLSATLVGCALDVSTPNTCGPALMYPEEGVAHLDKNNLSLYNDVVDCVCATEGVKELDVLGSCNTRFISRDIIWKFANNGVIYSDKCVKALSTCEGNE